MHIYRLRAGKRDSHGHVASPVINDEIYASDDAEAIKQARMYQVSYFVDNSDFAWLTDLSDRVVWSIKLEQAS